MQQNITTNKAIRTLMDDGLMIGRHRPLISKWFQDWVDEIVTTKTIPLEELGAMTEAERIEYREQVCQALIDELGNLLKENVVFTESKVAMNIDGWKPGRSIPKDAQVGLEVKAVLHAFRTNSKGKAVRAVSPEDSDTVLRSSRPQPGA